MTQAPELMAAGKEIPSETVRTFETYGLVALISPVMVTMAGYVPRLIERKYRIPGV